MASNQGGNQGNSNQGGQTNQGGGRGFASMDQARQREIASLGGRAAHERGTAHEFTSEEAREAGRKGGEAVSRDRAHMAQIGSKGGQSRGSKASRQASSQSAGGTTGTTGSSGSGSNPGSGTNH